MLNTPFSSWPCFTAEESAAVSRVLSSNKVNYWTGDECRNFEREFADWADSRYAVALMNGTVALDVALKVLGVGIGDEVVVSPRTFIASVSAVVNAGATPVFAEVDADSGNLSADSIEAACTPRTKAVICVHLAGWPCDMDPILGLAERRGIFVIEDCAQAHGAVYKGRSVGSVGHVGCWSFCQDKIMTTGGEGGMVTCNDESLWRAMWAYKDHGKSYEAVYERDHPPGFRWLHESFGTNWRMTEMQAAIGRIQLKRLEHWAAARSSNASAIRDAMLPFIGEAGPVRVPQLSCEACPLPKCGPLAGEAGLSYQNAALSYGDDCSCRHANYKFYAYVRPENLVPSWCRDRIVEEINARGVPCFTGSCSEIYLEKAFDGTGFRPADRLPVAKQLGETSLMFLVHPTLTQGEIRKTQEAVAEVLSLASDG